MGAKRQKLIEKLKQQVTPVTPRDSMAEAGRKVLLVDFVKMLEHEAGSRVGTDIEEVHNMRVATRRMRSLFRLLRPHFKPAAVAPYQRQLRVIARELGAVRDLDVMIRDLTLYQQGQEESARASLQVVIDRLDKRRTRARQELIALLDGKTYKSFVKAYAAFLTTPEMGAKHIEADDSRPYQVRHLLPISVYQHLGSVRAFDNVLEDATPEMLHALRIEFKRLRYLISYFVDVLGTSVNGFIEELKVIQDHLGRLNDIQVARVRLENLMTDTSQAALLREYITKLDGEEPELVAGFPEVWLHFNSRAVQRKLTDSLLVLR